MAKRTTKKSDQTAMQRSGEHKPYQGWTNHATWCVMLWIGNTEGWCDHVDALARDAKEQWPGNPAVKDGTWTAEQAQQFMLEDWLKEWAEEVLFEDGDTNSDPAAGFRSDMLRGYFEDVDWADCARHLLADLD